ncbi:hypothetical protein EJG51_001860 [Undibacterium piscinae]|uniref:DUF4148 domain-containing protein n=1 Tax=Undibacterium piscinae TaxID=2495591 RepID=A0A6M4A0B8_9BURK|nr:hypothetical protein EJG51_001860 [Undibacterium piscinae]
MNRKLNMFYSRFAVFLCLLPAVAGVSAEHLSSRNLVFDSSHGGNQTRTLVGVEAELPASSIGGVRTTDTKSKTMLSRTTGVKQHAAKKRRLSVDERRTLRRQIQEAEGDLYTQQK